MKNLKVQDLMTPEVVAVHPEDDLATLHDLMQRHKVRHMPVVGMEKKVIGIVTHRDLLRNSLIEQTNVPGHLQQALRERILVREVMVDQVETVDADCDLRDAAAVMLRHKYGCLPVVESQRLVGILTEADFVRFMAHGH